jgi:tetratricopeptide (TPR) repeat protein
MYFNPSISLCMIVKDEGRFLKNCLDSVKPIVSELIVVDTGSKDNTQAIAMALGAKLFQYRWEDDFSMARNFAISKASHEWILVLDADETISADDLAMVRKLTADSAMDAYTFIQRNYFKDKKPAAFEVTSKNDTYKESKPYSGWFPSELVRLFRNNKGYKFTGLVHEVIEPSIIEKGGNIGQSAIPIHHFGAEKPKTHEEGKKEKYLALGLRQIELTPEEPKPYFEVGEMYLNDRQYDRAFPLLARCIQLIESSARPERYRTTYCYASFAAGKALVEMGQFQPAAKIFQKLSLLYPASMVFFFLGLTLSRTGKLEEAERAYKKAIELNPEDMEMHNNLANLYITMARFGQALEELDEALKLSSGNGMADSIIYRNRGAAQMGAKDYQKAYESFQKAIELNKQFEPELTPALEELKKLIDQEPE